MSFNGRWALLKDDLWYNTTFDGRLPWPLMEQRQLSPGQMITGQMAWVPVDKKTELC